MPHTIARKTAYSDAAITALMLTTLYPYVLAIMDFTPLQQFHFIVVTLFILLPAVFFSYHSGAGAWEHRPVDMLLFHLERGIDTPESLQAEARIRALNLPFIHAASLLARYEAIALLSSVSMALFAGLGGREAVTLFLSLGIGSLIFPVFSVFLTERYLYPVWADIADATRSARIDESRVITVSIRTRLIAVLVAMVMAPLIAFGTLVHERVRTSLGAILTRSGAAHPLMWELSDYLFILMAAAILLSSGIGLLLAESISRPLGHLVRTIRRLERDDLHARANLYSSDEIGIVSQNFDDMADRLEQGRRELQAANRTLETRVAEKTENLTRAYDRLRSSSSDLSAANRELEEANRKLKEIDRLKSDFISTVSHELRTPLTSIKAFTELMLLKPHTPPEKRDKMLSVINLETDRLARLITDILDLTKIEAGKLSWHRGDVSIAEVIAHSVAGIQSLADARQILLSATVSPGLPMLQGDRDRLVQVMTNILSNALKHTPAGGSIAVSAVLETVDDRPQVLVSVTDTGSGIPPHDLEAIFEKFRRSGDVLTNRTEGTGLGLAISRQIIAHHGGRIWAESALGRGSTFLFTLPLTGPG